MIRKRARKRAKRDQRRRLQMIVKTSREDESSKGFGFARMLSSLYELSQAGADAILMANTEGQIKK